MNLNQEQSRIWNQEYGTPRNYVQPQTGVSLWSQTTMVCTFSTPLPSNQPTPFQKKLANFNSNFVKLSSSFAPRAKFSKKRCIMDGGRTVETFMMPQYVPLWFPTLPSFKYINLTFISFQNASALAFLIMWFKPHTTSGMTKSSSNSPSIWINDPLADHNYHIIYYSIQPIPWLILK